MCPASLEAGHIISIDNVMVFAVIFKSFNVPIKYQHRVLFIGIVSALVLRGFMCPA